MEIEKYRPIELMSSWKGGTSYQAEDENGNVVDLRIFKHGYFSREKWQKVTKRLLRLHALDHPGAFKIIDIEVINTPCFIAFEFNYFLPLADSDIHKWESLERITFAQELVNIMSEAHRLGIAHNTLSLQNIYVTPKRKLKLDFAHQNQIALLNETSSFINLQQDTWCIASILYWILSGGKKFHDSGETPLENKYLEVDEFHVLFQLITSCIEKKTSVQIQQFKNLLDEFTVALQRATKQMQGQKTLITDEQQNDLSDSIFKSFEQTTKIDNLEQLGRFTIQKKIGSGGMGVVYLAEDNTDKSTVALKVISPKCAADKDYLQRFYKEARLLAEVNNPFVANMLEINNEQNIHYLVMEFIAGQNVSDIIKQYGKVTEKQALHIIADIARALVIAHKKQVIHRDIKPANIILTCPNALEIMNDPTVTDHIFAKLSDFGLARHIVENESLDLTKTGAILGTPKYMSPEQCSGKKVDATSDLYSLGTTLFHLVTGHPPFDANTPFAIINKHVNAPVPSLKEYTDDVSDNLCSIVEKLLQKSPQDRYQNANELLNDLESLIRGEPTKLFIHPQLPEENDPQLLQFEFKWNLSSDVGKLWPHVTNTEKVNKALGLVAPEYSYAKSPQKGRYLLAKNNSKSFPLEWEEHPYEWLQEKRMSVLREYKHGIFKWMASIVEFHPQEQGTLLIHRFVISPRNWFARLLLYYQFKKSFSKKLTSIYQRIDRFCQRRHGQEISDAFAEIPQLEFNKKMLLQRLIKKSSDTSINKETLGKFSTFLERASAQDVARIRPLALAKQLDITSSQLVTLCLNGAAQGLLVLSWDIICPLCRIPSDLKETLREMKNHGHCKACNIDYELDFANSVELIFRIHPSIRESDLQVYCVGGPVHSPHVISQIKLRAKEHMELNLQLAEGAYLLRSPQLNNPCKFHVAKNTNTNRRHMLVSQLNQNFDFATGKQHVQLENDFDKEIVLRLEHTVSRRDILTAAHVSSLPLFRKLFPSEVLSPQQLVAISNLILLAVDLHDPQTFYETNDDPQAFQILYNYLQNIEQHVADHSGIVIKTKNEGIIASFSEVQNAIEAGILLQKKLESCNCQLKIKVAVHRGAAMVATINGRLDYFGSTIKALEYLLSIGNRDEVVFSQSIAEDQHFHALVNQHQLRKVVAHSKIPRTDEYVIKTPCA